MTAFLPNITRLSLAGAAFAALGLGLAAAPARAQDPAYDGPAYDRDYQPSYDHASYRDADAEIVVRARPLGRSSTTGAPIERVTTSRLVDYRDLDIDSPWGARELHWRIEHAARDACEELDNRYPIGEPDVRDCTSEAVRNAEHDVGTYDRDR
jgi:UrcA family protein